MEGWLLLSSTSFAPALPLPTVAYRAADFAVEYESKEGDGIPDAAVRIEGILCSVPPL
jgi:hypothetical protein